jgi:lysophospholipase L1-like esterase
VEYFNHDGVVQYVKRIHEIERGVYDFEAALDYNRREFEALFGNFRNLSTTRLRILREAVDLCIANNCRVYLFTTVHHPRLRDLLIQRTRFGARESEAIQWLQNLAQETGAKFVDLGNIESFGGDPLAFVDGIHPLEANTRRMADRLFDVSKEHVYALQ